MANRRVNQQAVFVLHTRPYTESSLIVEVFSQDYGRAAVLAKGARSQKTRKRGILQPFQPLLIGWTGKGELPILTDVEQGNKLFHFDYKSRVCGFYANELVYRLLQRHDPHPDLYYAYQDLMLDLHRLSFQKKERELSLRLFEKRLLSEIGYALILDRDVDNQELINPELVYRYVPERGPEIYQSSVAYSDNSNLYTTNSPLVVSGMVLHCIERNQYPNEQLMQQAKRFMRHILKTLLNGKPIYSRSLLYLS
jgi:DNA repair protein RecO (recombination protein O)